LNLYVVPPRTREDWDRDESLRAVYGVVPTDPMEEHIAPNLRAIAGMARSEWEDRYRR
jgi:hypothetical protein